MLLQKLELQLRGIRAAGGGDWAKFESAGVIDRRFNGEFRYWMTVSRATADSASKLQAENGPDRRAEGKVKDLQERRRMIEAELTKPR